MARSHLETVVASTKQPKPAEPIGWRPNTLKPFARSFGQQNTVTVAKDQERGLNDIFLSHQCIVNV